MLIGAPGAGKTSVSRHLSKQLIWPCVHVDALAPRLMTTLGMNPRQAESHYLQGRYDEWEAYLRPYRHAALHVLVQAFPDDCVIDVGAGFVLGRPKHEMSLALKRLTLVHVCIHEDACITETELRRRLSKRIGKANDKASRAELDYFVELSLASLDAFDQLASITLMTLGERPGVSASRLVEILRTKVR